MRLLLKLAMLLALCGSAFGQTLTTYTGTIKDLTQTLVTTGNVIFTLQPSADTTIAGGSRFTPLAVTCLINGSGLVKAGDGVSACVVTNNTSLTPAGTSYQVQICPNFSCTSKFVTYATGGSIDISTATPTPSTSPAYTLVDIFSNQTIGGDKTYSGSITGTSSAKPFNWAGPGTLKSLSLTGDGILDWYDHTFGCHPNRGVINMLDCGGVADGALITNGCGTGNTCFKGTNNVAAVRAAITAATTYGGYIYFPNAGTNIWMVGSATDYTACSGGTGALFQSPSKIKFKGIGQWTSVMMFNPGLGGSLNCDMFANLDVNGDYGVSWEDMRFDGNEITDGVHNDFLHPNNNLSSNTNGRFIHWTALPGSTTSPDGPATTMTNVAVTGFNGDSGLHTTMLIEGGTWHEWYNVRAGWSQWATCLWFKASDSTLTGWYNIQCGNWNQLPSVIVQGGAGNTFTKAYFGGDFAAAGRGQVEVMGALYTTFRDCVNDSSGAIGYRLADSAGVVSQFTNFQGGSVTQIGRATSGASDYFSLEGGTTGTTIEGMQIDAQGSASSHGVTELNTAGNTIIMGNQFHAIGGGVNNLRAGSGSFFRSNIGVADSPFTQLIVGSAGSTITGIFKGSATLTYGAIGANACAEQPLTITGATTGDQCYASPAADIGANFSYGGCRVSAANTAQVRVCSGAGGTPSAQTWNGWVHH